MNQNEIITAVVALMVCGLLAGTAVIPLIAGISQETINEEYNDESNAGWLRMAYDNKPFDVEITADGGNITAGGQTGLNDDMILYADASACVMSVDGAFKIVNGYAATPEVINATSVAITNAGGSLTVEADGNTVITADSPAWAYYPNATGKYAYFGADVDGVKIKASDNPVYAGNFAGVMAYNNFVVAPNGYGNLGMTLNAVVDNDVISSVSWEKTEEYTPTTSLNDYNITAPSTEWDSAGNSVKTYLGEITDNLIIPRKVTTDSSTRNITTVGYGSGSGTPKVVTNLSLLPNATVIIPDGVKTISENAFSGCSNITNVILSDDIQNISYNSFRNVHAKDLVLPPSIYGTKDGDGHSGFANSGFTNLVWFGYTPGHVYGISFKDSSIKEVLNMSDQELTTTSFDLNADEVRTDIPASGYIAPLSTSAVVTKEGAVYDLIDLLPLIMVLGVVMMGVYVVGTRYA